VSKRLDTVGVLARTVSDAMLVTPGIALESDHLHVSTKLKLVAELSTFCSSMRSDGIRIGIPDSLSELQNLSACKVKAFNKVLTLLESSDATVVRDVKIFGASSWEALPSEAKSIILHTNMKIGINGYLSTLTTDPHNINDLEDLIVFTKIHPLEEYPRRNVAGLEAAQATDPNDLLFLKMLDLDEYFIGEGGIDAALSRHRCDVMLCPTLSVTMQKFAAKAGSPVLNVPMGVYPLDTRVEKIGRNGLVNVALGIPFSAYVFGRAAKDGDVLKVGYVLERLTRVGEGLVLYLEARTEVKDAVQQ
jgi:amidase